MAPSGRVIGARDIRISSDKVTIEELLVTVITGITFNLAPENDILGVIVAHINRTNKFVRKNEVSSRKIDNCNFII